MEFRDALKRLRSEAGLAQADIAAALHVNIVTAGRWEPDKTVPGRSVAKCDPSIMHCVMETKSCIS